MVMPSHDLIYPSKLFVVFCDWDKNTRKERCKLNELGFPSPYLRKVDGINTTASLTRSSFLEVACRGGIRHAPEHLTRPRSGWPCDPFTLTKLSPQNSSSAKPTAPSPLCRWKSRLTPIDLSLSSARSCRIAMSVR